MKTLVLLAVTLSLWSCTPLPPAAPPGVAPGSRDITPVLSLLGQQAAEVTRTRVGTDGSSDRLLAQALNSSNVPGQSVGRGLYTQSDLEKELDQRLQSRPGYGQLVALLNPDKVIKPRANANFSVDFARSTTTEVTFLPGKKRRTYFYELGLTFNLLDPEGRIAYARETSRFHLQVCIIENQQPCHDIVTGEEIDPHATWEKLIGKTFDLALSDTTAGLQNWAELLRRFQARIDLLTRQGRMPVTTDGAGIRNQRDDNYPYLFLEVPEIDQDELIAALQERGEDLNRAELKQLKRYLTAYFRSTLDRSLGKRLRRSRRARQAGIFLLPDTTAIWFQDALERLKAAALDTSGLLTAPYGRETWPAHIEQYGQHCSTTQVERQVDHCLSVWVKYGGSRTVAGAPLLTAQYAQQLAAVSGVLVDLSVGPQDAGSRYVPTKVKSPVRTVAQKSQQYVRVINATSQDNDDRVYLRASALEALDELGPAIAEHVEIAFTERYGSRRR
ncbi:hypothetical protein [Candidatus Entotheonella palauensis]|uniref:hypothetical protein n=1 Tax=Candidatus Entotheonella palauensis TaxID=93172 RepID=UPI000B7F746D|nr:hypothetical protein [Candidatus Entotheonella palauensis]